MPYYVFRVSADKKNPTLVETCAKFADARNVCRELRKQQGPGDTGLIRMTFANSEKDAKRLLTEPRKESTPLEEWEA